MNTKEERFARQAAYLDKYRARKVLQQTSVQALLDVAYSLTHRMHAERDGMKIRDLRAQRDLITEELIRRTES